ncbi:MAG: EMC3/TMCO1 family protein [Nitrososphaerota archaeon]|jgi:uncharacterized membrane protein (DUF106 family)|nr:EMC3/TMCO1 family protein [Nitrososphaerota archaeon]
MKVYKKIMFVMLLALVACSALSVFAEQASAALSYHGTISIDNPSVAQDASYTLILTNNGTDRLLNATITVPQGIADITNLAVTPSAWTVHHEEIDQISYIYLTQTADGLNNGDSITVTFNAVNPRMTGTYRWVINGVDINGTTGPEVDIVDVPPIRITTMVPVFILLGIAFGVSLLSLVFNRLLISHFIGWEQYQVMRKETSEFQKAQMAAARANDQKQIEKLKRKQTQINNMQAKMMKTSLLQFVFMIVPWLLWGFVLIPTFGETSLAYLPGLGGIPMFWVYFPLSFFASTIGQRILGLNPIEPR